MLFLPLMNLGLAGGFIQLPETGLTRRREPRVVIALMFEIESIYLTSRTGMSNVPGVVVYGCIEDLSSSSQQLFPDEGRVTIGSMSFTVTDLSGEITAALRDQFDNNLAAVRGREVRVFEGESDDFVRLERQETYVIDRLDYDAGAYTFSCSDRAREMRDDIFDQATTRITGPIGEGDTTIAVGSTSGFEMMAHTAAFSDAPSAPQIAYLLIKKTKEIVGYTSKTETQFEGVLRGRFGTFPQPVAYDNTTTEPDRQPEIVEFIYLEMPAPQLAYAIMTGTVLNTAIVLPTKWHLGISTSLFDIAAFNTIGPDLFDPNDDTTGMVVKFTHLKKTDGKRFIEEQLHLLMGTFSPISSRGIIGLRRLARVVAGSSASFVLSNDFVISHGSLDHDQAAVVNQVDVDWNWDGQEEEYTRRSTFVHLGSTALYKQVRSRKFAFRGLPVRGYSTGALRQFFNRMIERYGGHPIRLEVQASMLARSVRVGDVVQAVLPEVRDFASASTLNRAMEVQERSINHLTGEISFSLVGSAPIELEAQAGDVPPIADGWYSQEGSPLTAFLTIVGGAVTANGTIPGTDALLTSVFYYIGDLTINAGVTVTLEQNAQLRILGSLTIAGTIDGVGEGPAPIADENTVGQPYVQWSGDPYVQTFGDTSGGSGVHLVNLVVQDLYLGTSNTGPIRRGLSSLPEYHLQVAAGQLSGLPEDLRGSPGVQGGAVIESVGSGTTATTHMLGSAGGAGGAGLAIITRGGLFFTGAGTINLSGADGVAPASTITLGGNDIYPGAGGGGAPGALLVVLDGSTVPPPDWEFTANRGASNDLGNPIELVPTISVDVANPWRGFYAGFPATALAEGARRAQFAPSEAGTGENEDEIVPKPTIVFIEVSAAGAIVRLAPLAEDSYETIEIWASLDNELANATLHASGRGAAYLVSLEGVFTRWYWARAIRSGRSGAWSSAPEEGIEATAGFPVVPPTALTNTWIETFDGYTSTEDIWREWYVYLNGVEFTPEQNRATPGGETLQLFQTGAHNGGKAIYIEFGQNATVRLVARRPVPYDANALYRCEIGFLEHGGAQGLLSAGFFSLGNDGVQIHESGTFASGTPTWAALNRYYSGNLFGEVWLRAIHWIGSSHTSLLATGPGVGSGATTSQLGHYQINPAQLIPLRADGSGNIPAYVVPVIEIVSLTGTSIQTSVDYFKVDRLHNADQFSVGVVDGNFSAANDGEFWTTYPALTGLQPTLSLGGGPTGGNALRFRNINNSYQLAAVSRMPIRLNGNTVTVAFEYKFVDNTGGSPGINGAGYIRLWLSGLKPGTVRRHYVPTTVPSVSQQIANSSLTTGGTWALATVTFTNVYSSGMPDADGFLLACGPLGGALGDNYDVYIGRVRVQQT